MPGTEARHGWRRTRGRGRVETRWRRPGGTRTGNAVGARCPRPPRRAQLGGSPYRRPRRSNTGRVTGADTSSPVTSDDPVRPRREAEGAEDHQADSDTAAGSNGRVAYESDEAPAEHHGPGQGPQERAGRDYVGPAPPVVEPLAEPAMRLGLREGDRMAGLRPGLDGAGLEQAGHVQPAFLCDHLGDLGAVGQPVPGVLYLFGCGGGRPAAAAPTRGHTLRRRGGAGTLVVGPHREHSRDASGDVLSGVPFIAGALAIRRVRGTPWLVRLRWVWIPDLDVS